jgi:glucose-6-phosphate 1-dehydrogenase
MIGDNILFPRADSVKPVGRRCSLSSCWKNAGAKGLQTYKAGSEGPADADELLKRDGRSWRKLG